MGVSPAGSESGLRHPADLAGWRRWQERQHPLRTVKGRLVRRARSRAPLRGVLVAGADPRVLVVLDSLAPSSRAALLAPVRHLPPDQVALLVPDAAPVADLLPDATSRAWTEDDPLPGRLVVSAGHYLPLGGLAHSRAEAAGHPHLVVQHGLITPLAPPLPPETHLAAWSDADAAFWAAGRPDVARHVVGSAMLVAAGEPREASAETAAGARSAPLVYLGQLHGAELPRRDLVRAAESFCRRTGATYRPHPAERDLRSRLTHARWERSGITVAPPTRPLADAEGGVVSVFSTGVLEAAARGRPAWVEHPDPPPWLRAFWERYAMARWGGEPTAAPERPVADPARAVADLVRELW